MEWCYRIEVVVRIVTIMMKVIKKTAITLYNILSYTKHYEIYGADNILAIMKIFL